MTDLVDVAENAFGLVPAVGGGEREVRDDLILVDGDGTWEFRLALRNRFATRDVDERIAGVRAWFAARGRDDFGWWVGTGSTPPDLAARLVAAGATPATDEEYLAAMVLDEEPPAVEGVDVRVVETFEQFVAARRLAAEVFGWGDFTEEDVRRQWDVAQESDRRRVFTAHVDGELAGRAGCFVTDAGPVQLVGAAVRPEYRGRGLYRALVRARWDEAVRRGTPLLVTQAGHLSRPVLARLGFRTVGRVRCFRDRTS